MRVAIAVGLLVLGLGAPVAAQFTGVVRGACEFKVQGLSASATGPIEHIILRLDLDTKPTLLYKIKTFAGRLGLSLQFILTAFEEEYQRCLGQTVGAVVGGLGQPADGASIRAAATSVPEVQIGPTHQWVVADFNQDGRDDSIVPSGNGIFVQLAAPATGELGPSRRVELGPSTHGYGAAAAGDVNGDARFDLVLCCSGFGPTSRLVVARGNGDGTFQAPVESIPAVGSFALTDWNGDGRLDVVTATGSGTLTVASGQGDGSFTVDRSVALSAQVVVAGDFTGDARSDVLALTQTQVVVHPGAADGSLGQAIATDLPLTSPKTLLAVDANGDRITDVAVFDPQNGVMAMLLGEGGGRFRVTGLSGTMKLEGSAAADFNNDGLLELILPNPATETLTLVPISRTGEIGGSPLYRVSAASAADAAAVADFNGDHRADLTLTGLVNGQAVIRTFSVSQPLNRLTPSNPLPITATTGSVRIAALAAADVDGDSRSDLVVLDSTNRSVVLLTGRASGGFDIGTPTPTGSASVSRLAVGDLNGDGRPDVAVSGAGGIRVMTAGASGVSAPTVAASSFSTDRLAIGDLNGDGRLDLVFTTTTDQQGVARAGFVLNEGGGVFGGGQSLDVPPNTGIPSVAIGDLNGDQRGDILLGGSFQASNNFFSLLVLLARPNETFSTVSPQREIDFEPVSLLIHDLDGDGKADLIAAHCCGELSTRVYTGRGDGTFSSAGAVATPQGTTRLWLTDVNGDGVPELVAQNPAGVSLNLFGSATTVTEAALARHAPRHLPT